MIPKVVFKVGKFEEYSNTLKSFILKENLFSSSLNIKYPELIRNLKEKKTIKEKEEYVEKYFIKQEKKFEKVMISVKEDFENQWKVINDEVMKALEEINETKWDKKFKEFTCRITLNPIAPRYLSQNMFDVYFGLPNTLIKTLIIHEVSHFIFFERLKQIMPKVKREEFESPHLIWKLSEIIPGVILKDKKIRNIFEPNEVALVYPVINTIIINKEKLLDTFQKFYDERKDFEDFIKKSYTYLQKNEAELKEYF